MYKNYFGLSLFSILNTITSIGLFYVVNLFLTLELENLPNYLIPLFFSLVIYSCLLNIFFQTKLVNYCYSYVYDGEIKVIKTLQNTSLEKLERYGTQRFYNILEDLRVFVFFPTVVTTIINSILMIVVCLGYLFWISTFTTLFLIFFISALVLVYFFINKKLFVKYENLRVLNEDYYKYIEDSLKGFKELKISDIRFNNFFKFFLVPNRNKAKDADIDLTSNYLIINLISQNSIFILLGFVLFFLTYLDTLNKNEIITYVVTLLFLNGPISSLVSSQSFITKALVAQKRIKLFFNDFKVTDSLLESEKTTLNSVIFNNISFENISFNYSTENNFAINDLSLDVKKGEVIFIVGGNGSGKSTFVNILTGLYYPTKGVIKVNNSIVNSTGDSYKNLFSVIYTDNHIFFKNYDEYILEGNHRYKELLKLMQLDSIVLNDEDNSIRRKFSKGQSKRVSMILALLEDKPILVLDEWAADQDPHFRRFFYEELIPILRDAGKTVIAVTHDDHYFDNADRILKFDYGHLVEDIKVQ